MVVNDATTRYGRVSYSLHAALQVPKPEIVPPRKVNATAPYVVHANISLPTSYTGTSGPAGGVKLRLRAPIEMAGRLKTVTVGGKLWVSGIDAKAETVAFTRHDLTPVRLVEMQSIIATFE